MNSQFLKNFHLLFLSPLLSLLKAQYVLSSHCFTVKKGTYCPAVHPQTAMFWKYYLFFSLLSLQDQEVPEKYEPGPKPKATGQKAPPTIAIVSLIFHVLTNS